LFSHARIAHGPHVFYVISPAECLGVDFIGDCDLTPYLAEGFEAFPPAASQIFHETNPGKTKLAAGQAVNSLRRAAEGIAEGHLILAAPKTGGQTCYERALATSARFRGI
jgi:hypothetical protein